MYPHDPSVGGVYAYSMPGRSGGMYGPGRGRGKGIGKGAKGKGVDLVACGQDVHCDDGKAGCFEPCAEDDDSPQKLSFVGDGMGDYIQETNYKFVGAGGGSYVGEVPRKRLKTAYCVMAAAGFCCAVVLMLVLFLLIPSVNSGGEGSGAIEEPQTISYNCQQDYATWQEKWATERKKWCCLHTGMACEYAHATHAPPAAAAAAAAATDMGAQAASAPATQFASVAQAASGKAAAAQHAASQLLGQPGVAPAAPQQPAVSSIANTVPAAPAVPQVASPASSLLAAARRYDCVEGFDRWSQVWAEPRQVWCCQHTGRGCPAQTLVSFNCTAALDQWVHEWSISKKAWCCQHVRLGCAAGMLPQGAPSATANHVAAAPAVPVATMA